MNTQRTTIHSGVTIRQFPANYWRRWSRFKSIFSYLWDLVERGISQAIKEERRYPAHIDELRWQRHIQRRELF